MQIPVAQPMANYPQPYATWAALRNDAGTQGDTGAHNVSSDSSVEQTTSLYTVDYTA